MKLFNDPCMNGCCMDSYEVEEIGTSIMPDGEVLMQVRATGPYGFKQWVDPTSGILREDD